MPATLARAAIPLARTFDRPYNRPAEAHAAWQSHVATGRIGNPVPASRETIARRDSMIALFDRIRAGAAA